MLPRNYPDRIRATGWGFIAVGYHTSYHYNCLLYQLRRPLSLSLRRFLWSYGDATTWGAQATLSISAEAIAGPARVVSGRRRARPGEGKGVEWTWTSVWPLTW